MLSETKESVELEINFKNSFQNSQLSQLFIIIVKMLVQLQCIT